VEITPLSQGFNLLGHVYGSPAAEPTPGQPTHLLDGFIWGGNWMKPRTSSTTQSQEDFAALVSPFLGNPDRG
jgi:hypothetical protein